MENIIIVAVLLVILIEAASYIIKAKQSGRKCIGCPEGCCSSKESGCTCGCGGNEQE